MHTTPFHDRHQSRWQLAEALEPYRERPHLLVLALPRGDAPVAFEVAHDLNASLDMFVVRKNALPDEARRAHAAYR